MGQYLILIGPSCVVLLSTDNGPDHGHICNYTYLSREQGDGLLL